jgi:hypothetical protein
VFMEPYQNTSHIIAANTFCPSNIICNCFK